jgi:uncharacterized protein
VPKDLNGLHNACEKQAPNTEEFRSGFTSAALDVANAAAIVLDAVEAPSALMAMDVAGLSRDTVDNFVRSTRNLDPATRPLEDAILTDPLMQSELRRQRENLAEQTSLGDHRCSTANRVRGWSRRYGTGSLTS